MWRNFSRAFDLLNARERRVALLLFLMMVGSSFMEMVGVASIMPFIAVIANPGIIENSYYLRTLREWSGVSDATDYVILLGVLFFVVIVGRIAFSTATQYAIVRFSAARNYSLSTRLFQHYLRQPYAWFLNQNSASLAKTLLSEVDMVVTGSLVPSLQLVSSTLTAACVISLIIILNPLAAIAILVVLGGAYSIIFLSIRAYLTRIGNDRLAANQQRFQIAQEVLEGIKAVKMSGLEAAYLDRFRDPARRFASRRAASQITGQLPRRFLEASAIGGMLFVLIMVMERRNGDLSAILPAVGLYAFAGMRLLPALQDVYLNLSKLKFNRAALDALHRDLSTTALTSEASTADNTSPLRLRDSITLSNLTFAYPGAKRAVLKNVSLVIPAKTTIGFIGVTGAGKTTLIDLMLGLLEPQKGELRVDGVALTGPTTRAWQRSIGYVPQHIFLCDDTIAANIAFGVPPHKIGMAEVERAAKAAALHDFITEQLPNGYNTAIGERGVRLSGGQRQRIGIARALYRDPDVLVFDEATSALDHETEAAVMDALEKLSSVKTILIIAHRTSTLHHCHRIFRIEGGKIASAARLSGVPDEVGGYPTGQL